MVRFDTVRTDIGGSEKLGSWVAVIRYRFAGEPLRAEDRYVNPLGFKVERYSRSAETLPASLPLRATDLRTSTPSASDDGSLLRP